MSITDQLKERIQIGFVETQKDDDGYDIQGEIVYDEIYAGVKSIVKNDADSTGDYTEARTEFVIRYNHDYFRKAKVGMGGCIVYDEQKYNIIETTIIGNRAGLRVVGVIETSGIL